MSVVIHRACAWGTMAHALPHSSVMQHVQRVPKSQNTLPASKGVDTGVKSAAIMRAIRHILGERGQGSISHAREVTVARHKHWAQAQSLGAKSHSVPPTMTKSLVTIRKYARVSSIYRPISSRVCDYMYHCGSNKIGVYMYPHKRTVLHIAH